jgi:hypothetical protein
MLSYRATTLAKRVKTSVEFAPDDLKNCCFIWNEQPQPQIYVTKLFGAQYLSKLACLLLADMSTLAISFHEKW